MGELKQLLKEKENRKDFHKIAHLLNELYDIDKQNLKDKKGIEDKILFFSENLKELKLIKDIFFQNDKKINEKDNLKDDKIEEKKEEKIILKPDEINELKNFFNNINNFSNEINNYAEKQIKQKCLPFYVFKQMVDGFININNVKENEKVQKEKKKISDEQKAQIQYKKICELSKQTKMDYDKLFGRLSNINLDILEENQVNKLKEISINIYYKLTTSQKEKIKEKYYELIKDKEIADILFLEIKNIFINDNKRKFNEKIIYKNLLENLSDFIEDFLKGKEKNKAKKESKKINRENVYEILLSIYKEFLIYKNEVNSYVYLNKNNIIEKIYYYLIINFLTYDDEFEDGTKFYKFLYIKYIYEKKYDYNKLINHKENIKEEINIYTEEDFKNKEKLRNDDLEEIDNEEEEFLPNLLLINNLKKIIPEEYIKRFFEVQQNISNFYIIPFPNNILVNGDNINFTFNIIDMVLFYKNYMNNDKWVDNYKKNLIKMEKHILDYYIESTSEYIEYVEQKDDKQLKGYKINKRMKKAYDDLIKYLYKYLKNDKNYKIQFIPFGSVTQFLSGKNGDIDLFMNIECLEKRPVDLNFHQSILIELMDILRKLDKNLIFHQTNRLCLYTFEYEDIKIDINVYGICSYYGEILLREYSLMDFRFPMLVVYLKYIISKYNIKNTGNDKSYINSFAWTNILLAFLQDILDPPLFPKLLKDKNKNRIKIKVGGGPGKNKKKKLENEIEYQRTRYFDVVKLDENNQIESSNKIKEEFYHVKEKVKGKDVDGDIKFLAKNDMSVSEILLKFVQFIGYFFNYKYTMVDSSYENQGFIPKIVKNKSNDEFVKCVFKKCDDLDDTLLIREPFDHTYNPCKSVPHEKLDEIQEKFRNIFINIFEKGEL